jgi:hypothetical protein
VKKGFMLPTRATRKPGVLRANFELLIVFGCNVKTFEGGMKCD